MSGSDGAERLEALALLADHPFDGARARPSPRQINQVFERLVALLRSDPVPVVRRDAAYRLARWYEPRAARALAATLANRREDAVLRGQCAEGLGLTLDPGGGRARATRAFAVTVLLESLTDPAPEVRFWSAYAVGMLRAVEARPLLERMAATDDAVCPHMWRVGEEARDALAYWDGGTWPERVPGASGSARAPASA